MRLYRGLTKQYKPEQRPHGLEGVNFTDNPYDALLYARGRQGQFLVLDVPDNEDEMRVRKALWLNDHAERLMVFGPFDQYIVGIIPAKELRKIIRGKGMAAMSDDYKTEVLESAIDQALSRTKILPITTLERHEEYAPLECVSYSYLATRNLTLGGI